MALTEIYVDPSINADSGTGAIGTPYGDLEFAIKQTTFDTTNGTRVNIKAGATEALVASLELSMADTVTTPAWVVDNSAPIVLQGYTAAADDGGRATISGGGSVSFFDSNSTSYQNMMWVDIDFDDSGAVNVFEAPVNTMILRCNFSTTSANLGAILNANGKAIGCSFTGMTGTTAVRIVGGSISYCYINSTSSASGYCIEKIVGTQSPYVNHNVLVQNAPGASGVKIAGDGVVCHNAIYCTVASTGAGITHSDQSTAALYNNLIQGWSGTGGRALATNNNTYCSAWANTEFDCSSVSTGNFIAIDWKGVSGSGNESVGATPFANVGALDFAPIDIGNVKEGSFPDDIGDGVI